MIFVSLGWDEHFNSAERCNFIWSIQIENYKGRTTVFVEPYGVLGIIYILPISLWGQWLGHHYPISKKKKQRLRGVRWPNLYENITVAVLRFMWIQTHILFCYDILPPISRKANLISTITAYLDRCISQRILPLLMICQPGLGDHWLWLTWLFRNPEDEQSVFF